MSGIVANRVRDLPTEYLALIQLVSAQLGQSCPQLTEEARVGFAVQIADATLHGGRGRPISLHLHTVGGRNN